MANKSGEIVKRKPIIGEMAKYGINHRESSEARESIVGSVAMAINNVAKMTSASMARRES